MAITDSTTPNAAQIEVGTKRGPYCKHDLSTDIAYQDAANWELIEARELLVAIATAGNDDDVALMAIVDKLRAAEHYFDAARELREHADAV
jgi:hypothetical protein